MAYTGYDPFGPAPDPSGGGLDPSLYYAISAGGRFPGDEQFFLEWLAAQSRGTAGGNPNYDVPDWMTKWGKLGKALGWHERNAQTGGEGQSPNLPGGYPYHFFSGPGASYGPPGGPLHGLVDQGRPGDPWDGADRPPYVPQDTKEGKKKGGGGGGGHKFTFTPYQGMQGQGGSFVAWQPTHPFSGSSGPTQFVQGGGAAPVTAGSGGAPLPGMGGGGGKGGGRGKGGGGGKGGGKGPGRQGAGGGKPGGGQGDPLADLLALLKANREEPQRFGAPGPGLRNNIGGGVNSNNLDMGTPGWLKDPTSGVHNTGGFPGPTAFAPKSGESLDSYMTRLHDSGFDSGSIGSLLGPYGFKQNDKGEWQWGWGTGPVVRGEEGYQFANQGPGVQITQGTGAGGGWGIGGAAGSGGGAAGSANGGGNSPTAADYISGGVFGLPAI